MQKKKVFEPQAEISTNVSPLLIAIILLLLEVPDIVFYIYASIVLVLNVFVLYKKYKDKDVDLKVISLEVNEDELEELEELIEKLERKNLHPQGN